jgi:hypothetical protein
MPKYGLRGVIFKKNASKSVIIPKKFLPKPALPIPTPGKGEGIMVIISLSA